MENSALLQTSLDLPLLHRGKVRDVYEVDPRTLLIVASDRLSAFDVVFDDAIPGKGAILNRMARLWFENLPSNIGHHMLDQAPSTVLGQAPSAVLERAMLCRKTRPLPVEAVVRGYLAGSGWKDYQASGSICGIDVPAGLVEAERLPKPIFTPATKAERGDHDENISFSQMSELIGPGLADQIRRISLSLYAFGVQVAERAGIIVADTKFEFGQTDDGALLLIDEIFTPDSSRFWPTSEYAAGQSPPSYDKQYVRDWVEAEGWDKKPPAPRLPASVIEGTRARYEEAYLALRAALKDENRRSST